MVLVVIEAGRYRNAWKASSSAILARLDFTSQSKSKSPVVGAIALLSVAGGVIFVAVQAWQFVHFSDVIEEETLPFAGTALSKQTFFTLSVGDKRVNASDSWRRSTTSGRRRRWRRSRTSRRRRR